MTKIVSYFRVFIFVMLGLVVLLGGIMITQASQSTPQVLTSTLYLPIIEKPEALLPSSEALLQITPAGQINASTFAPGSFVVTNLATHGKRITAVTIDLSTAGFPDMVFDPLGIAGDVVAKDLSIDAGQFTTGFTSHSFSQFHDDGYDVLHLTFTNFDPGEQFVFSIDVDPTSIRGTSAPGPYESGSVAGLELSGATVSVTFADVGTLSGYVYRQPGSVGGGQALIRDYLPPQPSATAVGVPSVPAVVNEANQLLEVNGRPRTKVHVLIIEGGLFTDGVANGGFDIDPFEVNSALRYQEVTAVTNSDGFAQIPITLTRSHPDGGRNVILIAHENPFGHIGQNAPPILLELQN